MSRIPEMKPFSMSFFLSEPTNRTGSHSSFCIGDPGGLAPLACKIFSKSCSFQAKGKTPILSKFWAQGPPGVNTPLGPPDQNLGSTPAVCSKNTRQFSKCNHHATTEKMSAHLRSYREGVQYVPFVPVFEVAEGEDSSDDGQDQHNQDHNQSCNTRTHQ